MTRTTKSNYNSLRETCAVCNDPLIEYAPLLHLPASWVVHIYNEESADDYHSLKTAFVNLCPECIPRFDSLKVKSWHITTPSSLDSLTQQFVDRIDPEDIINIK